jgi:hypothetical protein
LCLRFDGCNMPFSAELEMYMNFYANLKSGYGKNVVIN